LAKWVEKNFLPRFEKAAGGLEWIFILTETVAVPEFLAGELECCSS